MFWKFCFSRNILLTVRSELAFVFPSCVCIMTEYIDQSILYTVEESWIYIWPKYVVVIFSDWNIEKSVLIMRNFIVQRKYFSRFNIVLSRDYHILFQVLSRLRVNLYTRRNVSLFPVLACLFVNDKCT